MTETPRPALARAPVPFWWPTERGWIIAGLFVLTAGILWWTKPQTGAEPSEFFKAIAQATVLTGFLTACGFFFQASKGTAEANARADKAINTAAALAPVTPEKPS